MGEVRACVFIDCEAKHPSAFLSECVVVPQVCTAVRGVQVTGPCGVLKRQQENSGRSTLDGMDAISAGEATHSIYVYVRVV